MKAMALLALAPLVAVATVAPAAHAQLADALASTSFEYYPSAHSDDALGGVQLNVVRASVGVPFKVGKRTTLVAGAGYEMLDVHPSVGDAFQLHAPKLTVGAIQGFSDHWGMMAFVDGGFASDFSDSITGDDVLLSLTAVGTYKVNDTLSLGAGAVYDRRTGKLAPLPALLLNWRISERARLRGFAPMFVSGEYRATDWLDLGIRGKFEGNRFHLGEDKFSVPNLELAYSNLTLGPKVTFHVHEWVHVDVYGAGAVYRRYELFHDDESYAKYSLSPVVGYGVRLWFGPSGWQSATADVVAKP